MTKSQLIERIAQEATTSKAESERVLNALLKVIKESLVRGEKVAITGFGTFEIRHVSEQTKKVTIGPDKGKVKTYPAYNRVGFKVSKPLKEAVRNTKN